MATNFNTADCEGKLLGMGLTNCFLKLGFPKGLIKVKTNWSLDSATETFDKAYVDLQTQKQEFVSFIGATGFTPNNEEPVMDTSSLGDESLVRHGKPKFTYEFKKGYYWHQAAFTHNDDECAVILVWDNNVYGFDISTDGSKLRGLKANHFTVPNWMENDGQADGKTMITVQLANPEAYNRDMVLYKPTDFDYDEIPNVVDYSVEFFQTPTDGDTTCRISVLARMNQNTFAGSLSPGDIKISGKTVTAATPDTADKYYDVTVSPAFVTGEKHTPSLNDGTYDVVVVEDNFYKGSGKETTVVSS